jgi:hypothetical protein
MVRKPFVDSLLSALLQQRVYAVISLCVDSDRRASVPHRGEAAREDSETNREMTVKILPCNCTGTAGSDFPVSLA